MKTRRNKMASRFRGTQPIRGLLFDAISTLFVSREGLTLAEFSRKVAEDVLQRKIGVSAETIERFINRIRVIVGGMRKIPRSALAGSLYRGALNAATFTHFGYPCSFAEGVAISQRITRAIKTFIVPKERRRFVERLIAFVRKQNPGVKVAIVTNASRRVVLGLLKRNQIDHLFGHVYSAKDLGVTKTDPNFFRRVMSAMGTCPKTTRLIGNGVFTDLVATTLGIQTVWLSLSKPKVSWRAIYFLYGHSSRRFIVKANSIQEAERIFA